MAAHTFLGDADYALYRDLLAENCHAAEVEVWNYGDRNYGGITVTVHSIQFAVRDRGARGSLKFGFLDRLLDDFHVEPSEAPPPAPSPPSYLSLACLAAATVFGIDTVTVFQTISCSTAK